MGKTIKNFFGGMLLVTGFIISVELDLGILTAIFVSLPGWILLFNWND